MAFMSIVFCVSWECVKTKNTVGIKRETLSYFRFVDDSASAKEAEREAAELASQIVFKVLLMSHHHKL